MKGMNILAGVLLACVLGAIGVYTIRSLRRMLRSGASYFVGDWRRLLRTAPVEYHRHDEPLYFWAAIAFNAWMAALTSCFPLLILFMIAVNVMLAC